MALNFLLGEAGSGKSSLLMEEILQKALACPGKKYLLLVPEQFCFSAQRLLTRKHPRHALINIEVLSLDRLAARAFRTFGIAKERIVSDTVKRMLLSLAVGAVREQLSVYGSAAAYPGFVGKLSTLFAEWEMNGQTPDILKERALALNAPSLLIRKLEDLSLLYESFRRQMGAQMSSEERLPLFNKLLAPSDIGRVEELFLDGFTGFTAVQYRILGQLMARAAHTTAVFTLPPGEDPDGWEKKEQRRREALFSMSQEAIWRLTSLAREAGQKRGGIRYADSAPARPPALAYLTAHPDTQEPFSGTVGEALSLFAMDTPREEAELAAARIRYLTRVKGLRHRDIAVAVSDPALYLPLLENSFGENHIPFFADRRTPLRHHPALRLLEDFFEAAAPLPEREALLRYLKNPLSPLDARETDQLENYYLALGLRRGKRLWEVFTRPGRRRPGEGQEEHRAYWHEKLEQLNDIRQRALVPLQAFRDSLGSQLYSVARVAQGLKALLDQPEMEEKLGALAGVLEEAGRREQARVLQEALPLLQDYLDCMTAHLGHLQLNHQACAELLKSGLRELNLGTLSLAADQVLIGDLERSRFGAVKQMIFLGCNADLLPRPRGGENLLSGPERLLLASEEEPAYTDERSMLEERFYLHRLLSIAREGLLLSYAKMDAGRRAKQPGALIREIRGIFPDLQEQSGPIPPALLPGIPGALRSLARHMGQDSGPWPALYVQLKGEENPTCRQKLAMVEAGANYHYQLHSLPPALARALYGREIYASISRLESFALCPFRHFLRYGLFLGEREEMSWERADHGNFFHDVMEDFFKGLKEEGITPGTLSPADRSRRLQAALIRAEAVAPGFSEQAVAPYLLSRWESYFERYAAALAAFENQGAAFLPEAFELSFGYGKDGMPPIELAEGATLRLRGVIDRVDLYRAGETSYLRVVDYKTGQQKMDFGQMAQGSQLQLGAYLMAARALYQEKMPAQSLLPGGLYYARLSEKWQDDWRKALSNQLTEPFLLEGMTAREVMAVSPDARPEKQPVNSEGLILLENCIRRRLVGLGNEMLSGRPAAPLRGKGERSQCGYCPYASFCDRQAEGFTYRADLSMNREQYLQGEKEEENGL